MAGLSVPSGSKRVKELKVFEHNDGSPVNTPIFIARGKESGKTLYVGASLFSEELTGVEICRRLADDIDARKLKGRLIVLPIPNPVGFRSRRRTNPYDSAYGNVEQVFPGNLEGGPSQIMAHHIFNKVVAHADYVVDIHTSYPGAKCIPYIVVPPETGSNVSAKSLELARIFGGEVILADSRSVSDGTLIIPPPNYKSKIMFRSLLTICSTQGIPVIQPELGEGNVLEESYIEYGLRGVRNVMSHLGMIKGKIVRQGKQLVCISRVSVRPKTGGLLLLSAQLGQRVKRGQVVGKVVPPLNQIKRVEKLIAPVDGMIIRIQTWGTVVPGDLALSIGVQEKDLP